VTSIDVHLEGNLEWPKESILESKTLFGHIFEDWAIFIKEGIDVFP
jgi:hypothetical protein